MFTIVIDTLGSEQGVHVSILAGTRFAHRTGVRVVFVGNTDVIQHHLIQLNLIDDEFQIIDTSTLISMDEDALSAFDSKPDASILLAFKEMAEGRADAVVSAGHTGASVMAARRTCGLLPFVKRAGLCQTMPSESNTKFLLIDSGATLSATARDLFFFGITGATVANVLLEIKCPRIGILNVGSEKSKGSSRLKNAATSLEMLSKQTGLFEFIGNIEGHEIWKHKADVVVTDGVTGNVLLKSSEGLSDFIFRSLQTSFGVSLNIPAVFQKTNYGGAPLIGIRGTSVVCHGRADEFEIERGCDVALSCIQAKLCYRLESVLYQFEKHSRDVGY